MKRAIVFLLVGLLLLPLCYAGLLDFLVEQKVVMIPFYPKEAEFDSINVYDLNAHDGNFVNIIVNNIDANSITVSYLIDMNVIDMNVWNDANFQSIGVAKGAYLNWLNATGDSNFVDIGISSGIYAISANNKLVWNSSLPSLVAGFDDMDAMTATAMGSTVMGMNSGGSMTASGDGALAGGRSNMATMLSAGEGSFVYGYANTLMQAYGWGAIAMGIDAKAFGNGAVALGYDTNATGVGSFAAGYSSSSIGQASAVIGDSLTNYNANSLLVQDLNALGDANFTSLQAGNAYLGTTTLSGNLTLGDNNITFGVTDHDSEISGLPICFATSPGGSDRFCIGLGGDIDMAGTFTNSGILVNTGDAYFGNGNDYVEIDGDLNVTGDINFGGSFAIEGITFNEGGINVTGDSNFTSIGNTGSYFGSGNITTMGSVGIGTDISATSQLYVTRVATAAGMMPQTSVGIRSYADMVDTLGALNAAGVQNTMSSDFSGNAGDNSWVDIDGVVGVGIFSGTVNHAGTEIVINGLKGSTSFTGTNTDNQYIRANAIQASTTSNLGTNGVTRKTGVYVTASGTANSNYGIYISNVTGATENYGIWDASGADWAIDSDSTKLYFGEGQDGYIEHDGSSMNIKANAVGLNDLDLTGYGINLWTPNTYSSADITITAGNSTGIGSNIDGGKIINTTGKGGTIEPFFNPNPGGDYIITTGAGGAGDIFGSGGDGGNIEITAGAGGADGGAGVGVQGIFDVNARHITLGSGLPLTNYKDNSVLVQDLNVLGDANFAHLGISGIQFNEGGIVATGDSNFTNIGVSGGAWLEGDLNVAGNITTTGIGSFGKGIINQTADEQGLQINGFDDVSASTIRLYVNSAGLSYLRTANGNLYFRPNGTTMMFITPTQLGFYAQTDFQFGSSGTEHETMRHSTDQTVNSFILGLDSHDAGAARTMLVCDDADRTFNFQQSIKTNPTVIIHSAAQSLDEWVSISHDGTDANFSIGTGEFDFDGGLNVDGNLTLVDSVWEDIQIAISTVRVVPAVNEPDWASYKGGQVLTFSGTADNNIYFSAQLPHSYKEGTDIYFHTHYTPEDNTAGNARWALTCTWANQDSVFPEQTAYGVTHAMPEITDQHTYGGVAGLTGTGKTISSILLCGLGRMASSDAADTYTKDIYLASLDFHYEKNTIGSDGELSK